MVSDAIAVIERLGGFMTWTCADWPALMRSLLVALVGCGLSVSVGFGAPGQAPTQTRLARVLNGVAAGEHRRIEGDAAADS